MIPALVLDPFSGISGDMFLGALVDVGAPFETLRDTLCEIPELSKVAITKETVQRGPFRATRIVVTCPHEHAHRSLPVIREIIERADIKQSIKAGAIETFTALARAEGRVHGCSIEDVHFHEVGALDAIADIVGAHLALDSLGAPRGLCRTLTLGRGEAESEHGRIPVPVPATIDLLSGHRVQFSDRGEELVTPTGAAIVATAFEPLDSSVTFRPERVGYGAGSREHDGLPNVLRVMLGSIESGAGHVCVITSTIDDMNSEVYGFVMERLFAEGVLDVYYNSVMMKKNRPGLEVTVIVEEKDVQRIAGVLMSETTTLGVRIHREERMELARSKETIDTAYGPVQVKIAERPGGGRTMSPEYESCKLAAQAAGVPILKVYDAARRAWDAASAAGS